VSMAREMWRTCMRYEPTEELVNGIYEILKYYYVYPLHELERMPDSSRLSITYESLKRDPADAIASIYRHFGIEISENFQPILAGEAERIRGYRSEHVYARHDANITAGRIVEDLRYVFDRFGFERDG